MLKLEDFKKNHVVNVSNFKGGTQTTSGGEMCMPDGSCVKYTSDEHYTLFGSNTAPIVTTYYGVSYVDKPCQ